MRRTGIMLLSLAAALLFALPLPAGAGVSEPITGSFPLAGEGRLSLKNINGRVSVTTWDRREVRVEGTRTADSREHLDDVIVHMDAQGDRVTIRVEYKRHGLFDRDHGAEVDLRVTVPARIQIDELSLVNGDVSIENVTGRVHASTVNGNLKARGLGSDVELATVNGALEADFDRFEPDASVSVHTVNGAVDLTIPRDAGALVSAHTVNGGIETDFGISVSKLAVVGSTVRGTIGDGGAKLEVSTVNGGIRIRGDDGKI